MMIDNKFTIYFTLHFILMGVFAVISIVLASMHYFLLSTVPIAFFVWSILEVIYPDTFILISSKEKKQFYDIDMGADPEKMKEWDIKIAEIKKKEARVKRNTKRKINKRPHIEGKSGFHK